MAPSQPDEVKKKTYLPQINNFSTMHLALFYDPPHLFSATNPILLPEI
jgi:hypothetical protein